MVIILLFIKNKLIKMEKAILKDGELLVYEFHCP